jgi:hypothetical protein
MLRPVYYEEHGLRTLRELGRSYQTTSKDLNRGDERVGIPSHPELVRREQLA